MGSEDVERRLAAILSADVVGYSRMMGRDEVATVRTLTAYRDQIAVLVNQHRGRIVDAPGDNVMAEFPSATDGLQCAGEIQRVLQARNAPLPPERRMEFRVGLHLGEVMVEGERIYGDGVNVAARLEGLAEPGGICISQAVHDQVESKVRLRYEDLGEQEVKNIARPLHVYRARWETVEALGAPEAPPSAEAPRRSPAPLVVAALALLAVAAAGAWLLYSATGGAPVAAGGPSVAVLPFTNMSGDPDQEYFSDGLTEDLITDLSRVSGLAVIARNSVFVYKGRAVRVEEVGRELGVTHVLEGSVRKAGERVRISAQLIDAQTGTHVWAERYDRSLDDVFDLQDDVAESIVGALRVHLTDAERDAMDRPLTTNMEAYDLFLQGMSLAQRRGREDIRRAQSLLERAIELDPEFGPAYAALASTWMTAWHSHFTRDEVTLERASALAERALELDASHAPSLSLAAGVYRAVGRHEDAAAAARRAVELAPGSAAAHLSLANALDDEFRPEEAAREYETSLRLNPLDPFVCFYVGAVRFVARDYEGAVVVLRRGIGVAPDFIELRGILIATYVEMGRMDDARVQAGELLRINPEFSLEALAARNLGNVSSETAERILTAARKAGIPERPATAAGGNR